MSKNEEVVHRVSERERCVHTGLRPTHSVLTAPHTTPRAQTSRREGRRGCGAQGAAPEVCQVPGGA
jgi:hypothetical protein